MSTHKKKMEQRNAAEVENFCSCLLLFPVLNHCPWQILLEDILYSFKDAFDLKMISKVKNLWKMVVDMLMLSHSGFDLPLSFFFWCNAHPISSWKDLDWSLSLWPVYKPPQERRRLTGYGWTWFAHEAQGRIEGVTEQSCYEGNWT